VSLTPRVVLVHRRTELAELLARHGTRGQAEFFLRTRGRDLAEVTEADAAVRAALATASAAIPLDWRRGEVERADLDRFSSPRRTSSSWSARTGCWPTWPSTSTASR